MSRYQMLVRVLDRIRAEAAGTPYAGLYAATPTNTEHVWQARSRAYIHLYLEVMFGIDGFSEREAFVTDGGCDGGIDGYYIDTRLRVVFLIQSKFRATEENFENKPIELRELLAMQVKRILGGESHDDAGVPYNGKIHSLQRKISDIPDLGRYSYRVVFLANLGSVSSDALRRLTDGYPVDVFNFARTYKEILYPVLAGTLFKASGLSISLDLSNKSAGTKISYSVPMNRFDCEITVVFVPTIEIAKLMSRYKNSILLFNPRSYLEFMGESVNKAIRSTILNVSTNEFALLNNGITIVCDESSVNEQSGRKHRAQLFLLNPQIINGGQTAYTLSRVYDTLPPDQRDAAFVGKEVLVKAIALIANEDTAENGAARSDLIEKISLATNRQSVVTNADRASSDPLHLTIQAELYDRYGLLYERKRGEFSDAIRNGLIFQDEIVTRSVFARIYLASVGKLKLAMQKKAPKQTISELRELSAKDFDRFRIAYHAFESFKQGRIITNERRVMDILPKVYAATVIADRINGDAYSTGRRTASLVNDYWNAFLKSAAEVGAPYIRMITIKGEFGETHTQWDIRQSRSAFGDRLVKDIAGYFSGIEVP